MSKVNIKVVIRFRPIQKPYSMITASEDAVILKNKLPIKSYRFNRVFDQNTKQQDIYTQSGIDEMVRHVLSGYNSTIFAYGQTSAGKTYTMEGYQYNTKTLKPIIDNSNQGIIQRSIKSIFLQTKKKGNLVSISCSFLQIYNEKLFDLLKPLDMNQCLKLRWDKDNEFSVQNLSEIVCHSEEQMKKVWQEGIKKRIVASNSLNIASSRSHTIFRINVQTRSNDVCYYSRLQLVDLAGSQRSSEGKLTKQSIYINKSLFTLKKVINSLEAQEPYIPYRQSKLTSLLKHSVGGNSYCLVIACINPTDQCIQHTVSTLNYASKAKTITNNVQQIINTKDKIILALQKQNQTLKEQLRLSQKEIQLLTKIHEKKLQKTIKMPPLSPSPHLVQVHANISPNHEYFSQRLVQSINTVRQLLKSNKALREDLDKAKQKSQNYAYEMTVLLRQNQHLKSICFSQQSSRSPAKSQHQVKRLSVGKILERQKSFKEQILRISNKHRGRTQCSEIFISRDLIEFYLDLCAFYCFMLKKKNKILI